LFVGPLIMTPLRFGDTSRVSLNENSGGTVMDVLLVSSGAGVGGGDFSAKEAKMITNCLNVSSPSQQVNFQSHSYLVHYHALW